LCSRQSPNGKFTIFRILHFSFFGFVSDFVIRASNFSSLPQKLHPRLPLAHVSDHVCRHPI